MNRSSRTQRPAASAGSTASSTSWARAAANSSASARGPIVSSGAATTRRTASAAATPPGSRRTAGVTPRSPSAAASPATSVDLPAPSSPSTVIRRPRVMPVVCRDMKRLSFLAVLVAALALSACGSSGGSGGQLSKDDLVKQADAICKDVSAKLNKVPSPKSSADLSDYGNKASSIIAGGVDKLDNLQPSDSDKQSFDAFISAAKKQSDLAGQLADAAKSSDQTKIRSILVQAKASDTKGKAAAAKLGMQACGKGT